MGDPRPAEGAGEPGRRGRHRHQLGAPARRRRRRAVATRRQARARSTGACASPASARASTAPARSRPKRSSAPIAVLREYRAALDEHGVTRVRATATSAARDATNRDEFFTAAHDALGVTPELLSGRGRGGAVVPRCHRRPRRARALPRRRHRWWLHRVRARHRRAGRSRVARHRVRAHHRAVPAVRSACARGAVERGRGRCATSWPTCRVWSRARPTRATLVGLAGNRHHRRRDRARASPSTTPRRSTTSVSPATRPKTCSAPLATESGRAAGAQPGSRTGPGRRDRRRCRGAGRHLPGARLRRDARAARPTSSTAWCAARSRHEAVDRERV